MAIKCSKCGNVWEGNKENVKIKINGVDAYIKVAEYAYECPNCHSVEIEERIEESSKKVNNKLGFLKPKGEEFLSKGKLVTKS